MKTVMGVTFLSTLEEILDPRHSALLLVDMQNDFVSPSGHFATLGGLDVRPSIVMVPRLRALLEEARLHGVYVVHIQQTTLPGLQSDSPAWVRWKNREDRRPDYTIDGTWGQEFVPELKPLPGEPVVKKHRSSAFLGTPLEVILRHRGIQTVVTTGVAANGCVCLTSLDAALHDFYTVVVEDCVESVHRDLREAALRLLRARCDVISSAEVTGVWRRAAAAIPKTNDGAGR